MRLLSHILLSISVLSASLIAVGPQLAAKSRDDQLPAMSTVDSRFSAADQPEAPISIHLAEASWKAPEWSVKLVLTNRSSRVVTHFEVVFTENYQNARDVRSSAGESIDPLGPGREVEFETGGGFVDGRQCGRPVGDLEGIVFSVLEVTFDDGSIWRRSDSANPPAVSAPRSN